LNVQATSLRRQNQFANLGHAGVARAEQEPGDGVLHCIFREPERIACREAVIDHQPRQQQSSGIAAPCMDALSLPGELDGAGDMIEQARGAPGLGFVLAFARDLTGEGDRAIDEAMQAIAPGNRHIGAVVEPRVQVRGKCRVGAMATNGAR